MEEVAVTAGVEAADRSAMTDRVRRFDWAATPLGPAEDWTPPLPAMVDLMLATPQIATLAIGPERVFLYNDHAALLYGDRHPAVLGLPLAEAFPEGYDKVASFYDRVFAGESVHVPAQPLDLSPAGTAEVFDAYLAPVRDGSGRVIAAYMTGVAIGERLRAEERLRASENRLQTLMRGIPQIVWRAAPTGEWTWASPQWAAFTGQAETDSHGWGWLEAVHPDDRAATRARWQEAEGQDTLDTEFRLCMAGEDRSRWFQTRATPVRDAQGHVVEWLGTSTDVDHLRRLQDRQSVLLAELQHRVRNILTVVRSVFSRTMEAAGPIEEMADHFRGRLDSLARTQVVVTRNAYGLVDLEELVRDELLAVGVGDGPALVIDGPDVALTPKIAESIGLAIHELTTNALKYGALKNPNARLEIRWSANVGYGATRKLNLTWIEQGVPAIPIQPARQGFGSELITEALPYRLGAETSLEIRGGGIRCTITVPLPDEGGARDVAFGGA